MLERFGFGCEMASWVRNLCLCGVTAAMISAGISLLFTWIFARLISFQSPLPFSVACERVNTVSFGISLFVIIFVLGIMLLVSESIKTYIRIDSLENLKSAAKFKSLELDSTDLIDARLEHLIRELPQLRLLNLACTKVTDAGLVHLEVLTKLQSLNLEYTRVTDVGLEHLKGLTRLQKLYLIGTNVTETGITSLRKALPNCTIYR